MKKVVCVFILCLAIISCTSDVENNNRYYEFIEEYTATITVGGVVGIFERTFEIGEKYIGNGQSNGVITIRIAEHSKLNNDCPNSWCYQELLDVPSEFLKLAE